MVQISGWQPCSLVDFPGELACVVFTQGCNLRCPWCHNPELVTGPVPEPVQVERVLEHLRIRQGKLTGLVVTGGEPTLHGDLASFLADVVQLGYRVKLDTNGSRPDRLEDLLDAGLLDHVAIDVKLGPARYERLGPVGVDTFGERLQRSITMVARSGVAHEFRTTVCDGWHDEAMLDEIGAAIPKGSQWFLQRLRTDRMLNPKVDCTPVDDTTLGQWAERQRGLGHDCRLRAA